MKKLMGELHIDHDSLQVINPDGSMRDMNKHELQLYIVKLQFRVETNQFRIYVIIITMVAVAAGLAISTIIASGANTNG